MWDFANDIVFVEVAQGGPSAERIAQTITGTGFPARRVERERPDDKESPGADVSEWPEPIAAALEQAASEGRDVVIVYIHAPWCQPCQRLKAETFPDPAIQAFINQHAIFLDIDAERQPDVSRAIGVAAVPDVRILKADGTQVAQVQGFGTAEQFLAIFQRARQ